MADKYAMRAFPVAIDPQSSTEAMRLSSLYNSEELQLDSLNEDEIQKYFNVYLSRAFLNEFLSNPQMIKGQSSELYLERSGMHLKEKMDSSAPAIRINNSQTTPEEKQCMLAKINGCYFETGILSEADTYFESLVEKYHSMEQPLRLLSDIANHNINQEHILEGILHILSSQDYDAINPFGISIALACAVNHSPVIQDLLISCFESWDAADGIDILEKLQLDKLWLRQYRDQVVEQLKQGCQIV